MEMETEPSTSHEYECGDDSNEEEINEECSKFDLDDSNSTTSETSSFGLASLLFTTYSSKSNSVDGQNSSRASAIDSHSSTRRSSLVSDVDVVDITGRALTGLDDMLTRLANERFLELRRIQVGDRPVTGSDARANLDSFFQRALGGPGTEQDRIDEGEAVRPQEVAEDVSTLLQRSIVRNALQAGSFRSQLERSLGSRTQASSNQNRVQRNLSNNTQPISTNRMQPISTNRVRDQQSTRASGIHTVNSSANEIRQDGLGPVPPPPSSTPPPPSPDISTSESMVRRLELSVEDGMALLAETITEDLGRLQSLHLVSDMLRTDFRGRLERMVDERVQSVGNGDLVAQSIRSLPSTSHRRTAPFPVPQLPSHRRQSHPHDDGLAKEVSSLRQQVEDMKRLLSVSLELQMDTQRAVRQEVAGVFSAFMREYLTPRQMASAETQPLSNQHPPSDHVVENRACARGQCVICLERDTDTVLYQCGHMCVCFQCGLQLKQDGHHCPMCRAPIRDIIRAYTAA